MGARDHEALPRNDGFYWATILAACIGGETCADFLSHGPMGLGYGLASIILITGVVLALVAEMTANASNETRYWTTIVVMATAGTTMADFLSRTLELGYLKGTALLIALFLATFIFWRKGSVILGEKSLLPHVNIRAGRSPDTRGDSGSDVLPHVDLHGAAKRLPVTDARYWAAIMVASTLGTTAGDALTNGTELGFGGGAAILAGLLIVVLMIESRAKTPNEGRYWSTLILCSTIGAATGDYITHEEGLDWGYYWGSLFVIALFLVVLSVGQIRKVVLTFRSRVTQYEQTIATMLPALYRIADHLEHATLAPQGGTRFPQPPPPPPAVRPVPAASGTRGARPQAPLASAATQPGGEARRQPAGAPRPNPATGSPRHDPPTGASPRNPPTGSSAGTELGPRPRPYIAPPTSAATSFTPPAPPDPRRR
jgi:uncharacterized membrane-anchored protein